MSEACLQLRLLDGSLDPEVGNLKSQMLMNIGIIVIKTFVVGTARRITTTSAIMLIALPSKLEAKIRSAVFSGPYKNPTM